MSVTIVARKFWGAMSPACPEPLNFPLKYVLSRTVHSHECETDKECRKIVKRLEDEKRGDTIYSFLVGGNGVVYESSGFTHTAGIPTRVRSLETRTLYIGLIGHYRDDFPEIMLETQKALIDYGVNSGLIDPKYIFVDDIAHSYIKKWEPKQKVAFPKVPFRKMWDI